MDADSKFAIHAACREGKRESHSSYSIIHASDTSSGSLTSYSLNGPVSPECESLGKLTTRHEKKKGEPLN